MQSCQHKSCWYVFKAFCFIFSKYTNLDVKSVFQGTDWSEDDAEGLWNLVEDKVLMEDKLLHAKVRTLDADV
jgi:hypothetical protein